MKRIDRVNSELQRQMADIISNEIKDPRIVGSFISIVKVDTTEDLKQAKVYVSILKSEDEKKEVMAALKQASTYIRNMLKNRVDIRVLPELNFISDNSIEYGFKISGILNSLDKK